MSLMEQFAEGLGLHPRSLQSLRTTYDHLGCADLVRASWASARLSVLGCLPSEVTHMFYLKSWGRN